VAQSQQETTNCTLHHTSCLLLPKILQAGVCVEEDRNRVVKSAGQKMVETAHCTLLIQPSRIVQIDQGRVGVICRNRQQDLNCTLHISISCQASLEDAAAWHDSSRNKTGTNGTSGQGKKSTLAGRVTST